MMYLASLDEETKDKVEGYTFIHTKEELDRIVIDNLHSHRVKIRQDFAHEFFTPIGLRSYIDNVRKMNYNILIDLDIQDEVITKEVLIEKIKKCRSIEELIQLAVIHNTEFMDILKFLIDTHNANYKEMLEFSNQVSQLQAIVEEQANKLIEKNLTIQQEVANKLSYQSRFHALVSRINYQYSKEIDKTKLFQVDKNSYDRILYIKEITRVQYIDTFVYYLKEILKVLYGMPTRLIVIENYYADDKIRLYPNLKCHHELIERDVLCGDILMLGMQPKLMTSVLKNSSNVAILIVLDRGGYSVPHIKGDNVEVLYTLSDMKDKPEYIPLGKCISYSEEALFINYVKEFNSLDESGKISVYSSMEMMKAVINLLERK